MQQPSQLAGGVPPPQGVQAPSQGVQTGTPDLNKVMEVLATAVQQAVDQNGFVDMNRLVQIWPTVAQQAGLNIPFQMVLQIIQQNPNMLRDLIIRLGLQGIIANGRRISGEELSQIGGGQGGG